MVYIINFTNRKFVIIYVRSTLPEKTGLPKNFKFASVALVTITVAVLMLVYQVILCKFILYLKS